MLNDIEYNKLWDISQKLRPYYDIDKVKSWAVFVCSKADEGFFGEDVFDILPNEIIFYNNYKYEDISKEVLPIISEIQNQLQIIENRGKIN